MKLKMMMISPSSSSKDDDDYENSDDDNDDIVISLQYMHCCRFVLLQWLYSYCRYQCCNRLLGSKV